MDCCCDSLPIPFPSFLHYVSLSSVFSFSPVFPACHAPKIVVCDAGRSRIRLKSTGEVFSLVPPNCKAHNLIVGRTWVDSAGDFSLLNATTGARGSMYFTPCGWFGSGHHEVSWPPPFPPCLPPHTLYLFPPFLLDTPPLQTPSPVPPTSRPTPRLPPPHYPQSSTLPPPRPTLPTAGSLPLPPSPPPSLSHTTTPYCMNLMGSLSLHFALLHQPY